MQYSLRLNNPILRMVSLLIMAMTLFACSDDLLRKSVFDLGAGEACITFSVENLSSTRASSDDMETAIDHVYLLFFDSSDYSSVALPVAAVRGEVQEGNPGSLSFRMPLRLKPDTDYRLIAIANADDYVPDGFDSYADYIESWCRLQPETRSIGFLLYHAEPVTASSVSNLPMEGTPAGGDSFRFSTQNGNYSISTSIRFRRMVARVDVANIVKSGFAIQGISICNWRDASGVPASTSSLGNVCGVLDSNGDVGFSHDLTFTDMGDTDVSGIQQMKKQLYCFPNKVEGSGKNDKLSTALIIKALYGDDKDPTYYRVNLGLKGSQAEVKANTQYLVTINSVKGRGASTPEEAYASEESLVAVTQVDEWDIDGNYAMDDDGNFMVLSCGEVVFEGDTGYNKEVRILTSKGLSWDVEIISEDGSSSAVFCASKLSESAIAIGTAYGNDTDNVLSAICRVTAMTPSGGSLSIDINLSQLTDDSEVNEPSIPEDAPFALIPLIGDRVKVDHERRTIEIDGFDPDCFNSFIDIPFQVYINPSFGENATVSISSTLDWPLEGRISKSESKDYFYCRESFTPMAGFASLKGPGYVKTLSGELIAKNNLFSSEINAFNEDRIYISVGAMAPDDPALERTVTLSIGADNFTYQLTVKPRQCIIDDVVLTDDNGQHWLIMDRNIQSTSYAGWAEYIGFKNNGKRYQAYNYLQLTYHDAVIPCKFLDQNTILSEYTHEIYLGELKKYTTSNRTSFASLRLTWLKKYIYQDGSAKSSPFYDESNYTNWIFPNSGIVNVMANRFKVSKMRIFLESECPALNGKIKTPVCCFLAYQGNGDSEIDEFSSGYSALDNNASSPNSLIIMTLDGSERIIFTPTTKTYPTMSSCYGVARLVCPVSEDELKDYKNNYLGYGSTPHKLNICHPDTYESSSLGWIPY